MDSASLSAMPRIAKKERTMKKSIKRTKKAASRSKVSRTKKAASRSKRAQSRKKPVSFLASLKKMFS